MSKKCPKCESKDIHITHYPVLTDSMATCYGCGYADLLERFLEQTVLDHITQSAETLAEKLVYYASVKIGRETRLGWLSTITGDRFYYLRDEAIAATVAELKKEAEENE